jgi:hypothetical protein
MRSSVGGPIRTSMIGAPDFRQMALRQQRCPAGPLPPLRYPVPFRADVAYPPWQTYQSSDSDVSRASSTVATPQRLM